MLELSTVSDAVELMFHLIYNLLHFITVNFRVALHSKISHQAPRKIINCYKAAYLIAGPF